MLLKVDAAQLEWRVKVFLAQDKVGMLEIEEMEAGRFDIHTDNEKNFKLPSRTIAKNFVYQMIFQDVFGDQGMEGAGYGFAGKADFQHVFTGPKKEVIQKWTDVAQAFFDKYPAIYEHSLSSIRTAVLSGSITVPSGRFYTFKPEQKYGGLDWPRTKILNYPIQGFSADLVQIARLALKEKVSKIPEYDKGLILLINTVHDDIEADVDNNPDLVYETACAMEDSFKEIQPRFKRMYGSEINVPMAGEVKFGVSLNESNMMKFKRKSFYEDYQKYIDKVRQ
jgi:hypothetical protein